MLLMLVCGDQAFDSDVGVNSSAAIHIYSRFKLSHVVLPEALACSLWNAFRELAYARNRGDENSDITVPAEANPLPRVSLERIRW